MCKIKISNVTLARFYIEELNLEKFFKLFYIDTMNCLELELHLKSK